MDIPVIECCDLGTGTSQFMFPLFKSDQLKITFLPSLLQCAVVNNCRLILVIESSGDWSREAMDPRGASGLTVNDVSLDVVLESETRSSSNDVTMTWLRTVDKREGLPLWSCSSGGYQCCMLRLSGWALHAAPSVRQCKSFLSIYAR